MPEMLDSAQILAQRQTSLRIGELARALSSHTPEYGAPDSRNPADVAASIPHRTWQLRGLDKAIGNTLESAHKEIKAAFDTLIKNRTQVTHGTDSAHMLILSEEEITKLQKVVQTQSDRIAQLNINSETARSLNLEATMSAMRGLSDELKIAHQLNTNPQAVVDLNARAHGYSRIYEIGQQQGKLTMERDAAMVARGEKPPKGANRHAPLPDHIEAERRHYAHPLSHNGMMETNVVTQYRGGYGDGATVQPSSPSSPTPTTSEHKPPPAPEKPQPHNPPHQPRGPRAPDVVAGAAMAVTAGVAALATGATPSQAALAAGESALSSIPGVGGRLAPNRDEAAVRDWVDTATLAGTTAGTVAGAIVGTPVPVVGNAVGAGVMGIIGNQIAAIGADEYYRIKARHFEGKKDTVAPSMGEQLFMAALNSTIERTIPAGVMQTDTRFRTSQDNMLKDVGLGAKDKNGMSAADYLRVPQTRDAYLGALKDSLGKETNPKAREQIGHMVEACEKFVEMEGRRVARLQPYMKEIENKLAATLKVQHLAENLKKKYLANACCGIVNSCIHCPPHQRHCREQGLKPLRPNNTRWAGVIACPSYLYNCVLM
ncbi:MAG: hypothetical protein ACOYJ2_08790 [Rickettsiales bacterium]